MLFPLAIAAGGFALYEWWWKPTQAKKPGGATTTTTSASKSTPLTLSSLAARVPAALAGAQASVASTTPSNVTDPIVATAALAANALLHGSATDPAVQAVVMAFQRTAGITADGKYGPQTQAALRKYIPNAPAAPTVYGGTDG